MQTQEVESATNPQQRASTSKSLNLGAAKVFTMSGKYIRTETFDLEDLISTQKRLPEGVAIFLVKDQQTPGNHSSSSYAPPRNLLKQTPLLLTNQGFFLVAPPTSYVSTELRVSGMKIAIVDVAQARAMMPKFKIKPE